MKHLLKKIIPTYFLDLRQKWIYQQKTSNFQNLSIQEVFNVIFVEKHWGDGESVSGPGSSIEATEHLINPIATFLKNYQIKSILDLPCGDFHWMKQLNLKDISYIGGDIVTTMILQNRQKYEQQNIQFQTLNILNDTFPVCDLLLTRDCLVHFSYNDIFKSIENIKESGCCYLMTTSFRKLQLNYDITTGDWRPINLEIPPFNFPPPLLVINEMNKQSNNVNREKVLAVWKIEAL